MAEGKPGCIRLKEKQPIFPSLEILKEYIWVYGIVILLADFGT